MRRILRSCCGRGVSCCLALTLIGALTGAVGCDRGPRPVLGGRAPAQPAAQSTPEEAFQNIMDTLRRAMTDELGGLTSNSDGGFSQLQYRREIEEQLIPPSSPTERYQARVVVTTRYSYRFRAPLDDEASDAKSDKRKSQESGDLLDINEKSFDPVEALEAELHEPSVTSSKKERGIPRSVVSQTEDEEVQTYELEYIDDRWRLITRVDPLSDGFIQSAFEFALKRQ